MYCNLEIQVISIYQEKDCTLYKDVQAAHRIVEIGSVMFCGREMNKGLW